jgi:hypothetical protein
MGFRGQFALQKSLIAHVRFGSKADIEARPFDVRFTPKSGHGWVTVRRPLCAKSRHSALQYRRPLFDHLVSAGEQRRRHGEAELPRGLEIDRQLVLI